MSSRWYIAAAIVLLALAAGGCKHTASQAGKGAAGAGGKQGPQPVPVVVAPVVVEDYAPAVVLSGEMRATQRATLAAEVSGRVVGIAHRVGESHALKAGALISIDPSSYRTAVASAQADLAAAEQALARLVNGPRPQEIAAQEAAVAAARAKRDQAADFLKRQKELYDQGAIAETDLVAAQADADTAQANLDAAQQVLDDLRQGSRKEDIAAAKARVDQSKSSLEAAGLQLSRTSITPSFNAVVTAMYVEVGQYVGPGTPVCEVVADEPGEAWFNLPQDKQPNVKPGVPVEIRSDALPGAVISGKVISVSPAADPQTRQFPVRVKVTDRRLKPGMEVTGRILEAAPKPTLMLSTDAPLQGTLGLVVYRLVPAGPNEKPAAGGAAPLPGIEMVPVEIGENLDDVVVLLKGDLKPGDMLVTRGKEQLYPSAKVIPTNLKPQGQSGGTGGGGSAAADHAGEAK